MKRVSPLEKLYYVRRYLSGEGGSQQQCADEAGVTKTAFQHWLRKFETFGEEAFLPRKNARYPEELKQAAVKDYHSGEFSQRELCRKYRLSSMRQLYDWSRQYGRQSVSETAGEPDADGPERPGIIAEPVIAEPVIAESVIAESGRSGREVPHRGRKTTWEERLEIVRYCLEHGRDYAGTAAAFQVSYQQIYTWVRRYDVGGAEYLQFSREKKKGRGSGHDEKKAETKTL